MPHVKSPCPSPLWLWLAMLALPACRADEITVTLLSDDGYPPYAFARNGMAAGIYPDILRAAATQLRGYRLVLEARPWKRALAAVESGEAIGVLPPYYRPAERPYLASYSVPILAEKVVVYCREAVLSRPRPIWPDNYYGLRIGRNLGYLVGGEAFYLAAKAGRLKQEEARDTRQNLQKLIHQRLDCYLNDEIAIQSELADLARQNEYLPARHGRIVAGTTISAEHGYIGYRIEDERFPYLNDFRQQLDRALQRLQANGEIPRIVARYAEAPPAPALPSGKP